MTRLQIEYQNLLEQQRANRAKEGLTAAQVQIAAREQQVKEKVSEAQIADLFASVGLKGAQEQQALTNIVKTLADTEMSKAYVDQIRADTERIASQTELNGAQKAKVLEDINKVIADTHLSEEQRVKVFRESTKLLSETKKLKKEIEKIEADTSLSRAQKDKAIAETSKVPFEKAESVSRTANNFGNVIKTIYDMTLGQWMKGSTAAAGEVAKAILSGG